MNIIIQDRQLEDMRYPTVGDWYDHKSGYLSIEVSNHLDEDHMNLVAVHELIEVLLCKRRGITQTQVDEFDMSHLDSKCEPGDLPGCPYRREHRFAALIEGLLAHELGVQGYSIE